METVVEMLVVELLVEGQVSTTDYFLLHMINT